MKELILVKYGEMALKGLNKKTFEDMLIKNIKRRLKPLGHFQLTSAQSTTYITPLDEEIDLNEAADRVGKIFGIHIAAPAYVKRISRIYAIRAMSTLMRCLAVQEPLRSMQSARTRLSP